MSLLHLISRSHLLATPLHLACRQSFADSAFRRRPMSLQSSQGNQGYSAAGQIDENADSILNFWLGDDYVGAGKTETCADKRAVWFKSSDEFDQMCKQRYSALHASAAAGRLGWDNGYEGLAAVILMDQLGRNMFRNQPEMYALDTKALDLAKSIHDGGSASKFPPIHRFWLYVPHMHSESLEEQELGIKRLEALRDETRDLPDAEGIQDHMQNAVSFAEAHWKVIKQWGRFPHRNKILGREDTPEERKGLDEGSIQSF